MTLLSRSLAVLQEWDVVDVGCDEVLPRIEVGAAAFAARILCVRDESINAAREVGIIYGFRPCVGDLGHQASREASIETHLQSMIIRCIALLAVIDHAPAFVGPQLIRIGSTRRNRGIRQRLIDVLRAHHVKRAGSGIADFQDRGTRETLLDIEIPLLRVRRQLIRVDRSERNGQIEVARGSTAWVGQQGIVDRQEF